MTKCIIFGGSGFIGSHLARRLNEDGYEVSVFGNSRGNLLDEEIEHKRIRFIKGDFQDNSAVMEALEDIDYVFHYISTTTPVTATEDPIYDIESNIISSVRLFQACLKKNAEKIIFSSSGGTIYGAPTILPVKETDHCNPINPYAIGKLTIEKYLQYFNYLYGIEYKILRYSNPYGEGQNPDGKQGVIPIFLNKIRHDERPVIYGDGSAIRDYIYIQDAIDATLEIMREKTNLNIFNVGHGEGTSILELIEEISQITGKKIFPEFREGSPTYLSRIILDISRIKQETGWMPVIELNEGIKRTWKWIQDL